MTGSAARWQGVFAWLAMKLTDYEVPELPSEWNNAYAYKAAALEMSNNYVRHRCPPSACRSADDRRCRR